MAQGEERDLWRRRTFWAGEKQRLRIRRNDLRPILAPSRERPGIAPVASVFWASTGCPAKLQAFDQNDKVVDEASIEIAPGRKAPGDPAPQFELRVTAAEPPDKATMVAVDRIAFKVRLRTGERVHGLRVALPREVTTAGECREAFIEMFRDAR